MSFYSIPKKQAYADNDSTSSDDSAAQSTDLCECCYLLPWCCCPKRYILAFLCSAGLFVLFAIRCNIGIVVIKMTGGTSEYHHSTKENISANATDYHPKPDFNWTATEIGLVDSSFFWGYILTQIPGGFLANCYPAHMLYGFGLLTSCLLNMLIPWAVDLHVSLLIIVRVCQGLAEGIGYPAIQAIWRYWAPPLERSKLVTITFSGSCVGIVIGMPLSGLITSTIGWRATFYIFGLMGVFWWMAWWFFAFEKPATHPSITKDEQRYIEKSLGITSTDFGKKYPIPWKSIVTSAPVYAIVIANFCRMWTFYLYTLSQPTYIAEVLKFNIMNSGLLSALPYIVQGFSIPLGGQLADFLRSRKILSTTTVRKVFNSTGCFLESFSLLVFGFSQNFYLAYTFLVIAIGSSGIALSGFSVNHLDIAPRYAAVLQGISSCIGILGALICPIVVQALTPHETHWEWKTVFLLTSLMNICGALFYLIYATGDKQSWADPPEEEGRQELRSADIELDSLSDANQINMFETRPSTDSGESYFRYQYGAMEKSP